VAVVANPFALLPNHQGHLAVGLEPDQAVDDMDAGLLQLPGPGDVGPLVETGLQLDERRHLFAGLGRPDQGLHNGAVTRGAVEGLLYGQHGGVGGGLLDEGDDRGGEGVVGVMHEHLAFAKHGKQVLGIAVGVYKSGLGDPHPRRIL